MVKLKTSDCFPPADHFQKYSPGGKAFVGSTMGSGRPASSRQMSPKAGSRATVRWKGFWSGSPFQTKTGGFVPGRELFRGWRGVQVRVWVSVFFHARTPPGEPGRLDPGTNAAVYAAGSVQVKALPGGGRGLGRQAGRAWPLRGRVGSGPSFRGPLDI